MLELFKSIFGARAEAGTAHPPALVEAAIERAVDGTDRRLRALGNYRKRLREPALEAIDHVVRLVDGLPAPAVADAEGYRTDPCLRAMFASAERLLTRRAFDHILAQVLEEIGERQSTRQKLGHQRELLGRKLVTLQRAGWGFGDAGARQDAAAIEQELTSIEQELVELGSHAGTLDVHLDMLAQALAQPAARLRLEQRSLILDHRNVLRAVADSVARELSVQELHDGRGQRAALRMIAIDPTRLPRTDFLQASRRYA